HRVVDVQDRSVPAVVVGADPVDAERDRLHDRLVLERPRDALAASGARDAGPVRGDDAGRRRIAQERDAEDRVALARDPGPILVEAGRAHPVPEAFHSYFTVWVGR